MNTNQKYALAICAMLATGIALIAYGTGTITGKWSVGVTVFGAAISWIALELLDHAGGKHL